jgi:hypothetical protein
MSTDDHASPGSFDSDIELDSKSQSLQGVKVARPIFKRARPSG